MTTAHVEKFAELVAKDPALLAKLGFDNANTDAAGSSQRAAFITNAVKEAKALRLEFTEEEATEFMAAEESAAASGELSNFQLELVAGGKGGDPIVNAQADQFKEQMDKQGNTDFDNFNRWMNSW